MKRWVCVGLVALSISTLGACSDTSSSGSAAAPGTTIVNNPLSIWCRSAYSLPFAERLRNPLFAVVGAGTAPDAVAGDQKFVEDALRSQDVTRLRSAEVHSAAQRLDRWVHDGDRTTSCTPYIVGVTQHSEPPGATYTTLPPATR